MCLFSDNAFAIKGNATEALLYEFIYNQTERERMEKAGVKKLHPEGFYKICASGSFEEVEKAIKDGEDPKIPDADRGQTTTLHDAAAFNPDARVTALLIQEGVNINAQGNLNKRTALHLAILMNPNAAAVIKALAKGKPDYYLEDIDGLNPFQTAIKGAVSLETRVYLVPDENVLLALLDANPDYAKDSGEYSPLAAYFSRFEGGVSNPERISPSAKVLERLIRGGCSVNIIARGRGNMQEPLLFKAIKFDSAGKRPEDTLTRLFLENGADVYATSERGDPTVHVAAFYGNSVALKALLSFDAKKTLAGVKDTSDATPLHILAKWRVEDLPACGKMLLEAGADINARDYCGNTPFLLVAEASGLPKRRFEEDEQYMRGTTGRKKAVEFLVANGADVKAVDSKGRTPLHKLCEAQVLSKPDLEMFIKAGVNLNARDNKGETPLMRFIITSSDRSAFYDYADDRLSVFTENLPILKILGADPNVKNKEGKVAYDFLHNDFHEKAKNDIAFLRVEIRNELTLFNLCETGCDEKTIRDALAKGMDIDPVDPKSGMTPLHMAIAFKDEKTAKALIACGAPLENAANNGETPLGAALLMNQFEIASALIKAGADSNKKGFRVSFRDNSPGLTTSYLSGAVFYNDVTMFDFLMQFKPDLEFKSQMWSGSAWDTNGAPLHVAVITQNLNFAEKLIQNGANPSATLDRRLTSALHLAAEFNDKPMVELLLRYGAKLHADTFGKTPYDYATDPRVKELLKNNASK
jgi:ankyrin repeat protein